MSEIFNMHRLGVKLVARLATLILLLRVLTAAFPSQLSASGMAAADLGAFWPKSARINIDTTQALRPVNRLTFGHYVFANSWGNGIMDEDYQINPIAMEMAQDLGPTILRFATQPIFEDAIGDPATRPPARCGQESWFSHHYGIDEHMALVESLGAQAMIVVGYPDALTQSGDPNACETSSINNDLSQMVKRAAAWVAYTNSYPNDATIIGTDGQGFDWQTAGYWAQLRANNGHPEPYGIKYWEIGNELYYHDDDIPPEQYGEAYIAFKHAMKLIDPTIITGATFLPGEWGDRVWNRRLLAVIGGEVEACIVHPYYPIERYDSSLQPAVMAAATQAEQDLAQFRQLVEEMTGRSKEIGLIASEMGTNFDFDYEVSMPRPLTMLLGSLFHADLLGMLVEKGDEFNVQVGIQHWLHGSMPTCDIHYDWQTGERYRRPDYYALQMWTNYFGTILVPTSTFSETFDVAQKRGLVGPQYSVPYLASHASISGDKLYLLVINRNLDADIPATIHINGFFPKREASVYTLNGPDAEATNEEDDHNTVVISRSDLLNASHQFTYTFPAHSVTSIEFLMSRDKVYLPLVPITPSATANPALNSTTLPSLSISNPTEITTAGATP